MELVLTFARTNETIHAEHILLEAGLAVQVMPLPSAIRAGCGVCLRLPQAQLQQASALLGQAGIPVEGVYTRTVADGQSEYTQFQGNEHD